MAFAPSAKSLLSLFILAVLATSSLAAAPGAPTPSALSVSQGTEDAVQAPEEGSLEARWNAFNEKANEVMTGVNDFLSGGDDSRTPDVVEKDFGFFYPVPLFGLEKDDGSPLTMPLLVIWLVLGASFFTIRMGFVQFRAFWHAIMLTAGKYDNPEDHGEVSHFQALTTALSATVGLGNIAGVAIAVSIGGPGATFWMIAAGLLGMASKFTECTLGQMYRQVRPNGSVMGGAMYYLSRGLSEKGLGFLGYPLAVLFAILCMGGSIAGGNSFQVSQSLGALQTTFPWIADYNWVYGLVMAFAAGIVIIGGVKRIAATAEKIVPVMCGIYVVACLWILGNHAGEVPAAFQTIFSGAFNMDAGIGGIVGVLVVGFQRAAFSNEAGVGSAAIAHSTAKTEYPVQEGIVALLEPFIDTVVVCTMTALVIVITGAWNNPDPAFAAARAASDGASLTTLAMKQEISWFPYLLSVAVVLFAFSTMISWSYYGERCWVWLFGDGSSIIYKLIFLVFVFLGSVISATQVLAFGDLMILGMALPNILGVLFLSGKVKRAYDDYRERLAAGEVGGGAGS